MSRPSTRIRPESTLVEPAERAERGRLAAARRAQQRDQLAGRDVDRQPVEGVDRPVPAVHAPANCDGDAVAGRGGGRGSWTVMRRAPSTARWARRRPPAAKRAMTKSRTNAKTRAAKRHRDGHERVALAEQVDDDLQRVEGQQRRDRELAEHERDREDRRPTGSPPRMFGTITWKIVRGQPAPRLRAASASVRDVDRAQAGVDGAVRVRQDQDDVDEGERERRRADARPRCWPIHW